MSDLYVNESLDQAETLKRLIDLLDTVAINYMLTGSMAAAFYGGPRTTHDIDVVVVLASGDVAILQYALGQDFAIAEGAAREAFQQDSMFNVIDERSLVKIEVIIRDPKPDPDETLRRRRSVEWGDRQVKVIAPEDLIVATLGWARESASEMQLRDVRYLLTHLDLDEAHLRGRSARLGLGALLKKATMHDTSPDVARRIAELMAKRTPAERLDMALEMKPPGAIARHGGNTTRSSRDQRARVSA